MKTIKNIELLETLAKGIDPTTGEIFSEQSPYNTQQISPSNKPLPPKASRAY